MHALYAIGPWRRADQPTSVGEEVSAGGFLVSASQDRGPRTDPDAGRAPVPDRTEDAHFAVEWQLVGPDVTTDPYEHARERRLPTGFGEL